MSEEKVPRVVGRGDFTGVGGPAPVECTLTFNVAATAEPPPSAWQAWKAWCDEPEQKADPNQAHVAMRLCAAAGVGPMSLRDARVSAVVAVYHAVNDERDYRQLAERAAAKRAALTEAIREAWGPAEVG